MSKKWIVVLCAAVIVAGGVFMQYVGAHNRAVAFEEQIPATYEDAQNVLSAYTNRIVEMVQVPEMAKDHIKEIIQDTFTGRYGAEGSQAVFQFIQESNLNVDQSMYPRIMNEMAAGRKDFERAQRALIDVKRAYRTQLKNFWTGTLMSMAGFPSINIGFNPGDDDDYPVIKSAQALQSYGQGVDQAIKLR